MGIERTVRWTGATLALAIIVTACGGGGGGGSTAPAVTLPTAIPTFTPIVTTPTPSGSSTPITLSAWNCPTSQTASTGEARSVTALDAPGRAPQASGTLPARSTALLAVTYDAATAGRSTQSIAANETRAGATFVRSLDFDALGTTVRVVAVPRANVTAATAQLRAGAGVRSVSETGLPEQAFKVNAPTYTNDPYFIGFQTTTPPTAGATAPPATYEIQPYVEGPTVPGQWDMHAMRLEWALSYTSSNSSVNGTGVTTGPLGSGIKIAIIDTGEDANHPELSSKIVYQRCFLTNPNGVQSSGSFANDPQGHGTDVTGIAAAATNNALGFTGAGVNATIYAYRVFPTPNDSCATPGSTNQQCTSNSFDIANAINDAVAQGVDIISLSLGGGTCTNGQDPDPTGEGAAISNALAKNVIVIAASGNSGTTTSGVAAPGCDTGVIAVGASALADGQANGSNVPGGTPAVPLEYVASYSQSGTPGASPRSASAWGIVAPGGDPKPDPNPNDTTGATADNDDLHWIENIWTTTPYQSTASDLNFAGSCKPDYQSSGTNDCRTLIAGTSQATPHVAGAVAVILAANRSYHTPALMKQLLCTTADDIGDPHEGCGRINLERAIATALGDPRLP